MVETTHAISSERITLNVNGEALQLHVDPWTTLLDLIRERLNFTGSKKGCDHGQCGACTMLVDGRRVNSCLKLAITLDGAAVTTIEGLARADGELHPMQAAFVEHDAFQCGYCTPGQIMSAVALVQEGRARSREEIREYMSGNICRCGAYTNIVDAIQDVLGSGPARTGAPKSTSRESPREPLRLRPSGDGAGCGGGSGRGQRLCAGRRHEPS